MSVYKLTCSKSGEVYYGATKNTIEFRRSKGHNYCSCQHFINPKLTLVETCNLDVLYDREEFYIKNYPCVNKNGKGATPPTAEKIEYRKKQTKEWLNKYVKEKKAYCKLCDLSFQSPKKLTRHTDGYRHKLKYESYKKYGDEWKKHYLKDNQERYKLKKN